MKKKDSKKRFKGKKSSRKIKIKHMIQLEKKRRHQGVGRKLESRNATSCTCLYDIVKVLTVSKGIVVNFDTQSNRLNSSLKIIGNSFLFPSFFKCSFSRKKEGQEQLHRYSDGLSHEVNFWPQCYWHCYWY
jgi:hypothetical protein